MDQHRVLVRNLSMPAVLSRDASIETLEAALVLPEVLASSVADSTGKGYASAWSRFSTWCYSNGVPNLPASPDSVVLYFISLGKEYQAMGPVYSAR